MPFYIYKKLFARVKVEHLAATKDTKIKLKMYNDNIPTIHKSRCLWDLTRSYSATDKRQ